MGVYTEERSLELSAQQLSTSIYGLVGGFKKGPLNVETLITSRNQFVTTFGTPLRGELGFAWHSGYEFLRYGHQMKVVRVGDDDVSKSTIDLIGDDSASTVIGVIAGVSEGDWADDIRIVITSMSVPTVADNTVMETIYTVDIYAADTGTVTSPTVFNFSGVAPLETWTDIVFNDSADLRFVEKTINGNSQYITFTMSAEDNPEVDYCFVLAGGDDGTTTIGAADIIGTIDVDTGVRTGLQAFADPMLTDINLISAPGFNSIRTVLNEILTLAQTRFDCLAIVDTEDVNTAQQMRDFVLGSTGTPGNDWAAYAPVPSVSRGAIYGPWLNIFDVYNNEEICVPPSVLVPAQFAYNDSVAYAWFATAGENRGILRTALNVKFKLSLGDIETLSGTGINLNTIVVSPSGIIINDNKTLQRRPDLLQNINVVRLFMYCEKVLATATRFILWEPHDPITWRTYINLVEPFLRDVVTKRGITDFRVKCDAETNTPFYINNSQMVAELYIVPTTSVRILVNTYIVSPHGVALSNSQISPQ